MCTGKRSVPVWAGASFCLPYAWKTNENFVTSLYWISNYHAISVSVGAQHFIEKQFIFDKKGPELYLCL